MDAGAAAVRIVEYDAQWRSDFARLNLEWLERWFEVEPVDRAILSDPAAHILAEGGSILFAVRDDGVVVVGTVALKHEGDGTYELTKMAVDPSVRGRGIDRLLLEAAVDAFEEVGGQRLFLESN